MEAEGNGIKGIERKDLLWQVEGPPEIVGSEVRTGGSKFEGGTECSQSFKLDRSLFSVGEKETGPWRMGKGSS